MRLRNMKIFLESIDINATVAWNTWIDLLNLAGDETADPTVGERTILTIQRGWGSCEFFSFLFERHWNLTWIERRGIGKRENIKQPSKNHFGIVIVLNKQHPARQRQWQIPLCFRSIQGKRNETHPMTIVMHFLQ